MFAKKKHPLVIRTPENINKEYTEVMFSLGSLDVEYFNLKESKAKMEQRQDEIIGEQEKLFERVKLLSSEMDDSQKELQRKAKIEAEQKAKEGAAS